MQSLEVGEVISPGLFLRSAAVRLPRWPLLLAAVAVAFSPALDGRILAWDDQHYLEDSAIQGTTCFFERAAFIFSSGYFGNYNPLHRAGNWLEFTLFGRDAGGFHLVSLALHALNVLLVHRLAIALGISRWPAVCAALLFALHPSRVEVVAWISDQKDLGSSLFLLLALNVYAPLLAGRPGGRWGRLLAVGLLFVMGLLYKSMALTFPLLLLVLDAAWRRPLRSAIAEKIPFLAASAVFALLTLGIAPRIGPLGGTWQTHAATAIQAPWIYLTRISGPFPFSARLWVERPATFLSLKPLAAAAFLLALGAVVLHLFMRGGHRRWLLLGFAWPAVCLLPVLNIVPLPVEVADRYLYLALLGPIFAAADGLASAARSLDPRGPRAVAAALAFALVAALLVVVCRGHSRAYHDGETLWRASLESDPSNPIARLNLALELMRSRPGPEAARECLDLLDPSRFGAGEVQGLRVARARAFTLLGLEEQAGTELDRALEAAGNSRMRIETALAESRRLSARRRFEEAHHALDAFHPRWPMEEEQVDSGRAAVCLAAGDDPGLLRAIRRQTEWSPFDLALWNNREMVARRLGLGEEADRCARRFQALLGAGR